MDFLTYPLAALGMPLLMVMILKNENERSTNCKAVIKSAVYWSIGYFGMWILKWGLATVVLNENIFENAIGAAKDRTSQMIDDIYYSRMEVIITNIKVMLKRPYFFVLLVSVWYCMKRKLTIQKDSLRRIVPYILVFLMPFVWYMVMFNHSWLHFWFTYRSLCISIFAFQCGLLQLRER